MLNINFTFVVQLINFLIVYCLIERLLIRPAIALIIKEDEERLSRTQEITRFEKQLNTTVDQKDQQWREAKCLFAQAMPQVVSLKPELATQIHIEYHKPDAQQVEQMINECSVYLIDKVAHD